jgi:hypothetical protein
VAGALRRGSATSSDYRAASPWRRKEHRPGGKNPTVGDLRLFDYLIGAAEQCQREANAKRLGGLEVNH